ncbi:PKD domain-containing protein [Nocardia sp. NBC_01327]|uniref:PKD domain-containing protein n=1 Tax=Nocardia sp. NBC_01327 TaxID=2903593 RepID=UPI002E1450C3|nr:PKD domain-containing protein [Nocardia sp. NBC_01327]
MKLWRSRWWRAALLPALVGATAVSGPVAQADANSDYPLIIDVSTPADGQCAGTKGAEHAGLHGTTAVYIPPGVPAHSDVEWRILGGGQPIRSGIAPVNSDVVTVGFDIPQDELPADGRLRVDARSRIAGGAVGGYGKPWNLRVSRDCRPLHVVSVGDSVTWGQGLDLDRKFGDLTTETLGTQTGRVTRLHDYSVSGAALDAPSLHSDNAHCPAANAGGGELPDVFCQLEEAGGEARDRGYQVDLVLLDGCINDLDPIFGIPVGLTPGSQDLTAAVRRECGGAGAEPVNPAANVPYFSSSKLGYGGRGMQDAIEKAHALPGSPKVLVSNYFYGDAAPGTPQGVQQRWSEFVRTSAEAFRTAADRANTAAGETFAVAADGLFGQDGGAVGNDPKLWMNPLGDEEISLRLLACPPHSDQAPQCGKAVAGHADVEGARQYAKTFLLNPRVREWFGGGGPLGDGFTVSRTAGPSGSTVDFDATPAGGAIRQYEWYFGDGVHLTTNGPTASHAYADTGPNLPRLVVTDMTGHRSMYELNEPIVIG